MFKSLIDGHECTEHHYLVELVISRKAKKFNSVLPSKFWNTEEWKKEYKLQVIAARSLLKIFDIQDILAGLRSKEGSWIYSLQNRTLIDIIHSIKKQSEKSDKNNAEIKREIEVVPENITAKPKQRKIKNMMDSIEDLDADIQRHSF